MREPFSCLLSPWVSPDTRFLSKHNRELLRKRLHAFIMLVGIQEFKAKKLLKDATNRND